MLIIEDVSYRYKVREDATLKHVCLHVAKGEMLLLAGRSGCGKSTLINKLVGENFETYSDGIKNYPN